MFTIDQAQSLVQNFIDKNSSGEIQLSIDVRHTIEKNYGWIFFYNSKQYIETGNIRSLAVGCGPILFDKKNGEITRFGTAFPVEKYQGYFILTRVFNVLRVAPAKR
ncbi:MAG: YrhB domain-containing protein [Cyanobacteria bacterium P01_F01_bin.150]